MTNIKGERLITINARAGECYCISYDSGYYVNILNQTDGVITITPTQDTLSDEAYSCNLKLVEDAFYYDFCSRLHSTLYITSEGDGYISVVRTDNTR